MSELRSSGAAGIHAHRRSRAEQERLALEEEMSMYDGDYANDEYNVVVLDNYRKEILGTDLLDPTDEEIWNLEEEYIPDDASDSEAWYEADDDDYEFYRYQPSDPYDNEYDR